ncbi:HAMP domain-containing protein [Amycolatopsis sp. K13G38]|uniref:histidine kinase n=1 Tax=Amycolatopsis acididurans TaxID=2724524 RepID=A0ABX1J8F2_9PSEU|nr:ATP-binding protein [Amycolatopsis acididurans]NKQ54625.1 HAMP domain-containing protein [Amycolatopsis acididurans]
MRETNSARRSGSVAWPPGGWSLRTKVSVVLLLPVIVAVTLAGVRIRGEVSEAGNLSAVRDRLPVLRETIDLADLIGQEMIAAAKGGAAPAQQIDAVNAKIAQVQRDADFAGLPADTDRVLNTTLGRLSGLRSGGAGADPTTRATGYRDVIKALSDVVPGVIAASDRLDLDGEADTARSLVQLRAALAVQESLLRTAPTDTVVALPNVAQAIAESQVIGDRVRQQLDAGTAARFADAVEPTTERQRVLRQVLAGGSPAQLNQLLLPIATESAALGGLLTDLTARLSDSLEALTNDARSTALRDTALVLGALLGALAVALLMARSLLSPMRRLHAAALTAAHQRLPDTITRVRKGEPVSWDTIEPVGVETGEEIGQLARAFDEMQRQAVRLAGEQAELRKQVSEMFMTLARRSQSMVEMQLTVLEGLESDERDPHRLDELFRVDHLATRLRRNGENLQVLAGGSPARADTGPVSMVEVLRGATSEVKDYRRISLVNVPGGAVRSQAAADIVHILAELLENATRFSPPEEKVVLTADRGADGGLLVEVVDHGLGMAPEDLDAANQRLAAAGDIVGPETARRMGLFVVGRLAAPHGIIVRLRTTMSRAGRSGVTASVHVPGELILADSGPRRQQPVVNGVGYEAETPQQHAPANGAHHEPAPTPIFERVMTNWFTANPPDLAEPAPPSVNWLSAGDEARRAAESALRQPAAATAPRSGLPTRKPGAQLAPGAAASRPDKPERGGFRDPAAVRNNLSRHYNGMRAARQRTAQQSPASGAGPHPRKSEEGS